MIRDHVGLPKAVGFIERKLLLFDMSKVYRISLNEKTNVHLLHGSCMYPTKKLPSYVIRAAVNPHVVYPAYMNHWARILDENFKQGWRSGARIYRFDDVNEAAVHTLAHEVAHFLLREKQINEKNVEANCNMVAVGWLQEYKNEQNVEQLFDNIRRRSPNI